MTRLPLGLLVLVVVACGTSRVATRYDAWSWSIAVPDDLRIRPANDAADIWRKGPLVIMDPEDAARTLHVRVRPLAETGAAGRTALELVLDVAASADSEEVGPSSHRDASTPGTAPWSTRSGWGWTSTSCMSSRATS